MVRVTYALVAVNSLGTFRVVAKGAFSPETKN